MQESKYMAAARSKKGKRLSTVVSTIVDAAISPIVGKFVENVHNFCEKWVRLGEKAAAK